ncbi:unnamed protein product [Caretta caretta]
MGVKYDMAFDPRTTAMKFWSRNEFYINQRTCPANSIHYLLQKYFILPSNKQHMEFMLKKNPDDYHQLLKVSCLLIGHFGQVPARLPLAS